jgi:flagella basal body P-ring formation protein FlgA
MKLTSLTSIVFTAFLLGGGFTSPVLAIEPSAIPAPAAAPTRPLAEADVKELLVSVLQREHVQDKGELELRFTRAWQPITVPDEPITLKVLELPTAGVTPNCIIRFELSTATRVLGVYQMPVAAQVWREIWVARSPLKRGELLATCDRTKERRDVLLLRDAVVADDADGAMIELAENLSAGAPLVQRSVKLRTLVRRGQTAEALVRDDALTVSLKVEVLEDGVLGQQVRVRNLQSKREFRGKVQDEKTILVSL